MKVCHLKDDLKTSTPAGRQNASVVRTLFDLFFLRKKNRSLKQSVASLALLKNQVDMQKASKETRTRFRFCSNQEKREGERKEKGFSPFSFEGRVSLRNLYLN